MKMLVNLPVVSREGVAFPWLLKLQKFQEFGWEIYLNGGKFIKKIDLKDEDVYTFNERFLDIQKMKKMKWTKIRFIFFCLWRNAVSFPRAMKAAEKFDIIYTTSSVLDMVIIPYFLKISGKKIKWATVFDNIVPLTDPGNMIKRFLAWSFFQISVIFLKRADIIFVSHPELISYLLPRGFEREKLIVTGLGLEKELIEKAEWDERYESDALFIGRLNETKGIYDMLEVLNIVKKKYPGFLLNIMGDGDEATKAAFRKKIDEMDLAQNVRFLGYVIGQKKFDIIKSSRCFLFLSVSESFGLSLLEAVSCGLPAFAYELLPYRRIYKNQEVIISKKGDYKRVADNVIRLFEKGDFSNSSGKSLADKYDWERIWNIEHQTMKEKIR